MSSREAAESVGEDRVGVETNWCSLVGRLVIDGVGGVTGIASDAPAVPAVKRRHYRVRNSPVALPMSSLRTIC